MILSGREARAAMTIDRYYVRGQAESFVDTLSKLSAKERERPVSPRYAGELNKLLLLAKEVAPEHDARLWPEPIKIGDAGMGMTQVFGTYADVETAARQLVVLLPREPML